MFLLIKIFEIHITKLKSNLWFLILDKKKF